MCLFVAFAVMKASGQKLQSYQFKSSITFTFSNNTLSIIFSNGISKSNISIKLYTCELLFYASMLILLA